MIFDGIYRVVYDGRLKKFKFPSHIMAVEYILKVVNFEVKEYGKDRETEKGMWLIIQEDE